MTSLERMPAAVGFHWIEWCDKIMEGRFDGENSNYGLVNIQDQSYEQFATAGKVANRDALSVHRKLMK